MGKGSSIPYHLRLNKVVERELFVGALSALSPCLDLQRYRYVGMGGPFLEDFRVIHSRLGIRDMVCIENDENVHLRQKFNSPFGGIKFFCEEIESYLDSVDLMDVPALIWLDYTSAEDLRSQFETFVGLITNVASRSVLKLTLNANPALLQAGEKASGSELMRRRLGELRRRVGELLAEDAAPQECTHRAYGDLLLRSLKFSVDAALEGTDISFVGLCSFKYSDGQPMVTVAGVSLDESEREQFLSETQVEKWPYFSPSWERPETIDLPILSPIERIELQKALNMATEPRFGYSLPPGRINNKPEKMLAAFKRFYRVMPSFARVDV